ncbi:hypothetical protein [Actinomyces vulturis]|uniref:hypothetical protein n=1 Tax=Actinomyces vulturis TaxID=1857645 RepID=UPI00082C6DC1|nr:hypothetical protein [Actinomyces vulturis]
MKIEFVCETRQKPSSLLHAVLQELDSRDYHMFAGLTMALKDHGVEHSAGELRKTLARAEERGLVAVKSQFPIIYVITLKGHGLLKKLQHAC